MKSLWEKLGKLYETKLTTNKVFSKKKLYHLRMKDGSMVENYLIEFNTLISKLVSVGVKVENEDIEIILLNSISNTWDQLMMFITNS